MRMPAKHYPFYYFHFTKPNSYKQLRFGKANQFLRGYLVDLKICYIQDFYLIFDI